jgi:hypothetical protein
MKHTKEHNKIEFIHNPDFLEWVLGPTAESDQYWADFIAENPLQKKDIEHARFLIKGLVHDQKSLSNVEVSMLWDKIKQSGISRKRVAINLNRWTAAASIIVILGITGWFVSQRNSPDIKEINYTSIAVAVNPGNDIKLILSDNSEKTFATKDPAVKYKKNGDILVDSVILTNEIFAPNKSDKEAFNQLIVPKGKRSSLTFSDGTRLYLNSGSQVIYPVTFNKKLREIYISGEAYLEVTHDTGWPFIVKTDHLEVKVLGTVFNIKSYPDETNSSVVLVKGSVQAIVKAQKTVMKESELFTLDNTTEKTSLGKANVLQYVSWKDGWIYCTNVSIENIARELSRYYDVNIQFNDDKVKDITLTGKLDLKTDCQEILNVISFIAPVDYKITEGNIILSMRIKS